VPERVLLTTIRLCTMQAAVHCLVVHDASILTKLDIGGLLRTLLMVMERIRWLLFYSLWFCLACTPEETEPLTTTSPAPVVLPSASTPLGCSLQNGLSDNETNLLFIGNSLTYTNDLPDMVERLAGERGIKIVTQSIAYPNYALEDHWNDGCIQKLIASKKFDFVIVQQGPSSQEEGRVMLFEYGARINELCNSNGARLAFFMVWPAKANYHMFGGVISSYTNAALQADALLCPVGVNWKAQCDKGDFSYYGPDQFHPSRTGSEMAARTILNTLVP